MAEEEEEEEDEEEKVSVLVEKDIGERVKRGGDKKLIFLKKIKILGAIKY